MKNFYLLSYFLMLPYFSLSLYAQGSDVYGKGIRISLNEDGSKYIRFITWHQVWTRFLSHNPGTNVNGQSRTDDFDIGVRRSRFLWYTQITPDFLILTHIGINNQTFVNGGGSGTSGTGGYGVGKKPQIFLHDLWTEYSVIKDKLALGTGLHYWNGVSRLANASTLNFLALDAPIFNWALIEESDQFARQFGIYAKGKLGKLDYRIAVNKPFATPLAIGNNVGDAALQANPNRAYSFNNNEWASSGYLVYDFFEKESNVLPFMVGTYLGTKKVFNIGFGWHYHPQATRSFSTTTNEFKNHDMFLWGIDSFLDLPLDKDKGTAITAYLGYMRHDFGKNYVRAIGIMNEGVPAQVGALAQGAGNADWRIGTGEYLYGEAGYLLPKNLLKKGKLQPFASATYKKLEFLAEPSFNYAIGINYHLEGHHAKISLKYQTRSLYSNNDLNKAPNNFNLDPNNLDKLRLNNRPDVANGKNTAGELILQTMIYL
jgi:hypothetical protein